MAAGRWRRSGGIPCGGFECRRGRFYDTAMTKRVAVTEFGENWAALLDAVANDGDEVLVEKDGHVVAKLVSTKDLGPMHGTVLFEGDIVSPIFDPNDYDMK